MSQCVCAVCECLCGLWVQVYLWDFFSCLRNTTKAIPTLFRVTWIFIFFPFFVGRMSMCPVPHAQNVYSEIYIGNAHTTGLFDTLTRKCNFGSIIRLLLRAYCMVIVFVSIPTSVTLLDCQKYAHKIGSMECSNMERCLCRFKKKLKWSENTQVTHYKSEYPKYFQVFHNWASEWIGDTNSSSENITKNAWIVSVAFGNFISPLFQHII